jgi:hypothetical protein
VNPRNVKVLAVVVLILFGVLFALNSADRGDSSADAEMLFPELKSRLNDINVVTITDADGTITLRREPDAESAAAAGRWISPDHDGYPADTGQLRQLLLAIADAQKLEQKTSDPEMYERLGVDDPREDGGNGVLVSARGDDAAISLILGETTQGEFRYARLPEEDRSWLINQNPAMPDDGAGWLLPDVVDIDASRIESVVLRHADGEVISLHKADVDAVNFAVEDVPEGRELRYPSVANGIAGVLSDLKLQDVQRGDVTGQAVATAEFRTFDGLQLVVDIRSRPEESATEPPTETETGTGTAPGTEEHWIRIQASAVAPSEAQAAAGDQTSPEDEAAAINARVRGWSYEIASYKADQLTRRFEDLLSDAEDESTE